MDVSGALASIQIIPKQPDIIRTVDELVQQDEIKWFMEANAYISLSSSAAEEGSILKYIILFIHQ